MKVNTINVLLFLLCTEATTFALKCRFRGKEYANGETFKNDQFLMKCIVDGQWWEAPIVACLTENGTEVPIGESRIEGKTVYACTDQGNGVVKLGMMPA
ncbi:hypothetical protein GCK32_020466 [Trichostrongylus colubriformis]|uniref:Abnormal cell migration protein 18-like fibronectin type I domain-containing protein n=1 Tax=Trichostrongylus colubriformis TaxID=6319 RepID=A0AAN8FL80_TRICO